MSEIGAYLRERFEEIVDPIDVDILIDELQTGERTVSPLPPERRDIAKGWLVAAAAAAVVLIAGGAWLLFAAADDVSPADQPIVTEEGAIDVVERLFDAFNRNDFAAYVALLGEFEVASLERAGDGEDIMSFSHELQGAWTLNTCRAFAPVASVEGIAVTCNASYQSRAGQLLPAAPRHETLNFRVGTDGVIAFTQFEPRHTDLQPVWDLAIEAIDAEIPEGVDPATLDLDDPCNVLGTEEPDGGWQYSKACSDWIWDQIDARDAWPDA